MSNHNEISCTKCGSLLHHDDDCHKFDDLDKPVTKKIIIVTPFRNSAHNLNRYFQQLTNLAYCFNDRSIELSLVAAEGDSVDNTKDKIVELSAKYGFSLNLLDVSHGQMSWKSVEDPRRLEAMSIIMNQGLEGIKSFNPNPNPNPNRLDGDIVVWLMSDIEYNPETLFNLISMLWDKGPGFDILSPNTLMGGTELFYDTWAYRKDGNRFSATYPYYGTSNLLDEFDLTFPLIDSAGTCLIMRAEVALNCKVGKDNLEAVSFCADAKSKGYNINLAAYYNIYHIDVKRPKLLLVAEVLSISGNSRATHQILPKLSEYFDIDILGKNYKGQPHTQPYKIYPYNLYSPSGMTFLNLVYNNGYDVVIVQGDTFDVNFLMQGVGTLPEDFVKPRLIGWLAVDGMNQQKGALDTFDHIITWTSFGKNELVKCGLNESKISVIPLGVDTNVFKKLDKLETRKKIIPKLSEDTILIGSFAINHYRKRLDILLHAFSLLIKSDNSDDNSNNSNKYHLLLLTKHVPNGFGCDLEKLIKWFNLEGKVTVLDNIYSDSALSELYNCLDIYVNCSLGEGFCLPILEAIACGVEIIIPQDGALQSWIMEYNLLHSEVAAKDIALMSPMNSETGWIVGKSSKAEHLMMIMSRGLNHFENGLIPLELTVDHVSTLFVNTIKDLYS